MASVSQDFLSFLCQTEGLRTEAYRDSGGVLTIGCGHTGSGVYESPITKDRAYDLARQDVSSFEGCIERNVTAPLTQGMVDALVSMAYNMGCSGLLRTGIVDLVNQQRYRDAGNRIPQVGLTDRNGTVLDGLKKRRREEQAMFFSDGIPNERLMAWTAPTITVSGSRPGGFIGTWTWWSVIALATVATATIIINKTR